MLSQNLYSCFLIANRTCRYIHLILENITSLLAQYLNGCPGTSGTSVNTTNQSEKATSHIFKPNNLVLKNTPGLCSSLETSWKGLYKIVDRISDVTYSIVRGVRSQNQRFISVEEVCFLISLS